MGTSSIGCGPSSFGSPRPVAPIFEGKRILVTGGTGSFGKTIVRRLLTGEAGWPRKVTVFSRDEGKHHDMRTAWLAKKAATEEVAYRDWKSLLEFRVGDVRDYDAIFHAARSADVVIHAAALKQVPSCEYAPLEAVKTNILGASNVVRASIESDSVELAIAISTDKAVKPVNVMGMTKALQERVFVTANLGQTKTKFICVRYGNVISSRGSVVPLFLDQIAHGGPVTITNEGMTRFMLTLDHAVDAIFAAAASAGAGEIYVPRLPAARVIDLARALIGDRLIDIEVTGTRPGEKIHEILVSEEEVHRTIERDCFYVIRPIIPELTDGVSVEPALTAEYSSREVTLDVPAIRGLLGQTTEEPVRISA